MTLPTGSRLGPYEVVAPLGAGGMGEVYRARDPRLARDVAIKVLPESLAGDAERMARFQREAQVLAALNHAHIAGIYGVEESGAVRALVLELVEGDTLAERLAAGPVEPEEALRVARAIADALEAAHEKGIIHRDLKPANVKLTPEGKVKVLDFGLAKALAADPSAPDISHSPTITAAATRDGIVIGTAAYMSPEQARGKPVDRRSDVWSFGAVLYEMLAGRQAFRGETVSDTIAAILTRDPDWSALPGAAPPSVRRLLARCLARDRNERLHDIADARIETEEALAELRRGVRTDAAVAPAAAPRPRSAARVALLVLLGLGLVGTAFFAGRRAGRFTSPALPAAAPTRSIVPLPEGTRLAGWASPVVALSRDGRSLAFVAAKGSELQQLYVHRLDTGETRLVPDSETAEGPFFSPDGDWVAFATDVSSLRAGTGALRKYSLSTGLTQAICEIPDYFGGAWSEDGTIYFVGAEEKGLWRVAAGGGKPAAVATTVRIGGKEEPHGIIWPGLLPGGKSLIVSDEEASRFGSARVLELATRELKDVVPSAMSARYVPTGHLIYVDSAGTLFAVPFDPAAGKTTGSPVAAAKGVAISANGSGVFAASDSGTLVYATGYIRASGRDLMRLVRIDRGGTLEPLPFDAEPLGRLLRISPDGRRLAVASWDLSLWICDLERSSRARLPNVQVNVGDFPAWTRDGERVAFAGTAVGQSGWKIFRQKADASAEPEVLVGADSSEKHPMSFAPDGRLLYDAFGEEQEVGIWSAGTDPKEPPRRLLAGKGPREPMVSPDGQWLAYSSGESGTIEVYVQKYPELGHRHQVSSGGGRAPIWSRDGREIVYRKGPDAFYAARFEAGAEPKIGSPRLLFEKAGIRGYDVAPDGNGIYAVFQPADSGIVRELHLVTNWFEELKRLAPAQAK